VKYNELKLTRSRRPSRVGRGIAGGKGKTAGRGTKGQGSRKSGGVRPGFEGGQTPIYMRIPKLRGFRSFHTKPVVVQVGQLELIKKEIVDSAALAEAGLIDSPLLSVKLLDGGELKSKKTVKLHAASVGAIKAIEKAGGKFEKVARRTRASNTPKA